jgi:hypothetical protein
MDKLIININKISIEIDWSLFIDLNLCVSEVSAVFRVSLHLSKD